MVIAVIGCGRISGAHFPGLCNMEDVRIKYACDILIEKAEAAKEKFPKIEKVTQDYQEVLADPEVEAIWVLTPNYAHYTITMDALRAGKHVMCEKPAGVYTLQVREMMAEADKHPDLKFGMMFNQRTNHIYRKVKEIMAEKNSK